MVAYNFQARFVDAVENKIKRQTIRAWGKRRHAQKGDALQLYTGQRTTSCRLLLETTCTERIPIIILPKEQLILHLDGVLWFVVAWPELFAKLDGFNSADEFFEFFGRDGCELFRGCLIKW